MRRMAEEECGKSERTTTENKIFSWPFWTIQRREFRPSGIAKMVKEIVLPQLMYEIRNSNNFAAYLLRKLCDDIEVSTTVVWKSLQWKGIFTLERSFHETGDESLQKMTKTVLLCLYGPKGSTHSLQWLSKVTVHLENYHNQLIIWNLWIWFWYILVCIACKI